MKSFGFTKAGREWNEDAYYVCKDFGFVLDGETVITGQNLSNAASDAQWYSNRWAKYLKVALKDFSLTIPEILEKEIPNVKKDYNVFAKGKKVKDFPSSTISIIRVNKDVVEYYVLGDSPILVKSKTGYVYPIHDVRNDINDDIIKSIVKDFAVKEGVSVIEAKQKYPQYIYEGRMRRNNPGSYYVLRDDVKAIKQGIFGAIPKNILDKILIMSDGYSQVYDLIGFMSEQQLINKINTIEDAEEVYNTLYTKQDKDKGGDKYVRFKIRDDATVVMMKFD